MLSPVIAEELDLLEKVTRLLGELPPSKTANEAPLVRELERLREVIISGDEAKDLSALTEQYHHQSAVLSQLRAAGGAKQVEPSSPYFAHLRLREEGRERDLCLGRATCIEKGIRIVDWRDAPISKIFYSYRQGDEYDEEIAGRERLGEVLARRTVRIRDGRLERVQSPEGDFAADESAPGGWRLERLEAPRLGGARDARAFVEGEGGHRRLGTQGDGREMRADKRLPEVTSLIDPDQFELITRPSAGFLVIRGVAGSGKTTVALHRVAYLAFADPAVDGPETMVVVFSRALRNYVSHVLPSLGLDRVRISSYAEWARVERLRHFPTLPPAIREDTPSLIQRVKLHPFLASAIERRVAEHGGEASWQQAFDDYASVLSDGGLLDRVCEAEAPGAFSSEELGRFASWNEEQLAEVLAHIAGSEETDAALDPEDDALLLFAHQLRAGPLRGAGRKPVSFRHVVIDEVQDFSPLEVRVLLGCMGKQSSITLAGDTQQHVVNHSGFTSWAQFFSHLGIPGAEVDTLRVSYRSSRPIVHFARELLGDLFEEEEVPMAPRDGPAVELFRFEDSGLCVAFLADALRELVASEPLASVAVLTPTRASSSLYYEGLSRCELPRLRQIREQDFGFGAGIEVTEIEQVKGLEFDYVVLVDVDARHFPEQDAARRLLHVGATRAIHQLWLSTVEEPSPLVARYFDAGRPG